MNGLVKDFAPGAVIVLIAHPDQMGTDCEAGNIEVLGEDGLYLGIKGPVLSLKSGAVPFPGVGIDKIFRCLNGGKSTRRTTTIATSTAA